MYVERLTSPDALQAFEGRRNAVFETAAHYGIDAENAVVIGSGAMAMHGLDAHAELPDHPDFDLDVINVEKLRGIPGVRWVHPEDVPLPIFKDPEAPLELMRITRGVAPEFYSDMGYRSYGAMLEDRVVIDGLSTVPVRRLVAGKLHTKRPKHFISLLKAHLVATATGHEVLSESYWHEAIAESLIVCQSLGLARRYSVDWLDEVMASLQGT